MRLGGRTRAGARRWRRAWRRTNIRLLRLFLRIMPSERRRVYALTLVVGALCGLAAVAFHLAVLGTESVLIESALEAPAPWWVLLAILAPTLGGLVAGVLLTYFVPDARGSGIPQVKVAYAVQGGRLPFRVAVGKFVIGTLQIGSGASLGREGPTVQICAGIASMLGRAAALSRQNQRALLPVGAAAGIAAAFNAPIAAVTFTIEEIIGDLDQTILTGVIVAAALAAAIERGILGTHPVLEVPQGYGLEHVSSLLLYAMMGVAAAAISIVFTDSLLHLRLWFRSLTIVPVWARPGIGGFVTGALAVAVLFWLDIGGITGGGYNSLSAALSGSLAVPVLLALCFMKLAATVFSYSSGGAGGIFAPALFIGGMLGGLFGYGDIALFGHEPSTAGAFALVGMGAVFAGIIRAPITSVLIIFEMTGGYGLILPLMIANMTAYALARRWRPTPIYEALLEQDDVHLPHGRQSIAHVLERLRVGEAMTSDVRTLPGSLSVAKALERITPFTITSFPVLDDQNQFIGLISEPRLRRTLAEGGGDLLVGEVADRRTPVFPEQRLLDAMVMMDAEQSRQIAVVDRHQPRKLIGVLSLSDIVRVQARAAAQQTASFSEVRETLEDTPMFKRLQAFRHDEQADQPAALALRYHQIEIGPGAPAAGQEVRELHLPEGVLLVTIDRDGHTIVPQGGTVLQAGDTVTLFADWHHLPQALEALCGEGE